ncbi:MAG: NAD(P)H-hydrate dehydratase [Actinobacteria bacterium]|nr:NAD(P)H-hydrate dehydratase [Actinomycetota bacterium]
MIPLHGVAQVLAAEAESVELLDGGVLMQRAAHGLALACTRLLTEVRGGVVGARVVVLVGSGNNGGDALWAGSMLVARGCRVDALTLSDRIHEQGAEALSRSGGRIQSWKTGDERLAALLTDADLVVDGIVGIGGAGGLRPDAAALAEEVLGAEAVVVAVDVPSGIDADTGIVAGAALRADVTVTFGAVKPGLVVAPGSAFAGVVHLVDIGIGFATRPVAEVLEDLDVAAWVLEPAEDTYKYRRGVVGVAAGSRAYPGAALLVTAAARHANVGMVRYLDRADGNASHVIAHFPDVVVDGSPPAGQERVGAWACGSGFPGDQLDEITVLAVLEAAVPVVLDAGALTVVAESAGVQARIAERAAAGLTTVLTPHDGEFERIRPGALAAGAGRLVEAQRAAADLQAVVVLKGPGTVIAAPDGTAYVDTEGTSDLGTAGSGDVLTGIIGGLLAGAWAAGRRDADSLVEATAAAVWLHGAAGRTAAVDAPITATDVAAAVPAAVAAARFGAPA